MLQSNALCIEFSTFVLEFSRKVVYFHFFKGWHLLHTVRFREYPSNDLMPNRQNACIDRFYHAFSRYFFCILCGRGFLYTTNNAEGGDLEVVVVLNGYDQLITKIHIQKNRKPVKCPNIQKAKEKRLKPFPKIICSHPTNKQLLVDIVADALTTPMCQTCLPGRVS